jgi:hypothetical protein
MYGITYYDFQKYIEGKFTGCEVINAYMHLLEETYNNDEKIILCSPILSHCP